MQTRPDTGNRGVVQWMVPPTKKPKRTDRNSKLTNGSSKRDYEMINENDDHQENVNHGLFNGLEQNNRYINDAKDCSPIFIDITICRTICSFVEINLKELEEHQKAINLARTRRPLSLHQQTNDSDLMIAANDTSKLKIRDEQTKANATIKQLTNYLRELTYLERQCETTTNRVDEEVINKLSENRTNIIQALNDFILTNSDFDLPIIDADDINGNEYDLCFDARAITKKITSIDNPNYNPSQQQKKLSTRSEQPLIIINDIYGRDGDLSEDRDDKEQSVMVTSQNSQIAANAEKRRRDIVKLEKDTEEMRHLFSEFYNLVKCQGEQIDRIEDNIVITAQRISEGQHTLNKAKRSLTILMPVTGCMAGALIGGPIGLVIGGKLGGLTVGCVTSLLGFISSYSVQRCIAIDKIKDD